MKILVIGAGVSGLSCAARLLEAGHVVEIWARDLPRTTTSACAAAIWHPHLTAPADRALAWSAVTFRELEKVSSDTGTGVTMRDGVEVFRTNVSDPWWKPAVPSFRRATAKELPSGYEDGYALRVPVADMTLYLKWLTALVIDRGGRLKPRPITTLADTRGQADAVVNCSGLGARDVASDPTVYGVRGQIQVVDAPAVTRFVIDGSAAPPTYVIPRASSVVLGGTADAHVEDVTIDDATTRSIRERCIGLVPALADARVIANRAGIRPCRPEVRVEREVVDGRPVIHNYGHGGAGVTLSWGCADDVVRLIS